MTDHRILRTGKLDPALLAELLARNPIADPRVLVGPGIGRDTAVLEMGDGSCLVATTDPITFASDEIGWYAAHVNANDVATAGARPRWFMATVLLPDKSATREMAETIMGDILAACSELGVTLIGGHTEVTNDLSRPIVSGCMMGEARRECLVRPEGAQPGDALLLTKRLAIEGTAVLGNEFGIDLAAAIGPDFPASCSAFLHAPGLSVVQDALLACESGGVHAMHDPTEGGVVTGIHELCTASGCGVRIRQEGILSYDETRRACAVLGLDILGLLASGSLLIVVDPAKADDICARLRGSDIECNHIGDMLDRAGPRLLVTQEGETPLPTFERDEIARLLAE